MKFNEIIELLNERIEDQYVHNTNVKRLLKILEGGCLVGTKQYDNCSKNSEKKELCISRSDMIPQNTGSLISSRITLGNLIKIQLKMNNIINGKLGVKKPYPVSYGNFKFNEIILDGLRDLLDYTKYEEDINVVEKLIEYFDTRSNYENLNNSKNRKFNLTKEKFFSLLNRVCKNKESLREVERIKKTYNNFERYNPELAGEERLYLENKKIPVNSKYMTINVPKKVWEMEEIQKYVKKYNDPKLFKVYDDSSERISKKVGNLWKT